ncbi:type I restriction/modification system, S subunit [Campylobacter peloridis LMG 23910]|nr:type I restriction/modification system, S subunit [Campylobacter peloridis]AJC84218.1 type I restriction/modification system, S subunit [Campylobacter peloridis LMG 23910]
MQNKMTNLPLGWEVKKLGDIVKLKNGFAFKSNLFCNDGIPIIRIKNIQNENIILDDLVFCNPNDYKNSLDNYLIFKNDILIAMSGATTGKIGIYNLNDKAYLNQRIGLLRIDNNILRKYVFWFLYCNSEQNLANAFGAAQPNLSTEQIHNIEIPIPPLQEQERIVGILDESFANIDESIKILEQDLLNLDELMQSALQKAFNPLKDNSKGNYQLPQGWEWKSLGDIAVTSSGGTPSRNKKEYWENGTIKWLKSGELNDGYINFIEENITQEAIENSSAKIFPKGTLLIAMYGATAGKLGILDLYSATNQAICAFLHKDNKNIKFFEKFLFYFLFFIRDKIIKDSFGGAQPNISQTYIKNLQIPLPPLQEQEQIASYLDELSLNIKDLKQNYKAQIKNLQELKKSLLDKAFKGRL